MISIDYMHSENIWFSWSKSSNYRGKLRCHACDGGRTEVIGQSSGRTETAIGPLEIRQLPYISPNLHSDSKRYVFMASFIEFIDAIAFVLISYALDINVLHRIYTLQELWRSAVAKKVQLSLLVKR